MALEVEQGSRERERPKAVPKPSVATPEAFEGLYLDRQRPVVQALVEPSS